MSRVHLINILDEQVSVGFTGRVNILITDTKQILGSISIHEGEIVHTKYKDNIGLKSFFNLCIDEFENVPLSYVVEPELIDLSHVSIHYPYSVLKRKIAEVVEQFRASKANKPPENLKILIRSDFIDTGEEVNGLEFDLLNTITEFNRVKDIYQNSNLLDFEVTNSLVSLRKKNALTVVKNK